MKPSVSSLYCNKLDHFIKVAILLLCQNPLDKNMEACICISILIKLRERGKAVLVQNEAPKEGYREFNCVLVNLCSRWRCILIVSIF